MRWNLIGLMAIVATGSAAESGGPATPPGATSQPTLVPSAIVHPYDDRQTELEIRHAIRQRLAVDPSTMAVAVEVSDGTAILTGTVDDFAASARAAAAAYDGGARRVDNRLLRRDLLYG
jgi:hypothetical protein